MHPNQHKSIHLQRIGFEPQSVRKRRPANSPHRFLPSIRVNLRPDPSLARALANDSRACRITQTNYTSLSEIGFESQNPAQRLPCRAGLTRISRPCYSLRPKAGWPRFRRRRNLEPRADRRTATRAFSRSIRLRRERSTRQARRPLFCQKSTDDGLTWTRFIRAFGTSPASSAVAYSAATTAALPGPGRWRLR